MRLFISHGADRDNPDWFIVEPRGNPGEQVRSLADYGRTVYELEATPYQRGIVTTPVNNDLEGRPVVWRRILVEPPEHPKYREIRALLDYLARSEPEWGEEAIALRIAQICCPDKLARKYGRKYRPR